MPSRQVAVAFSSVSWERVYASRPVVSGTLFRVVLRSFRRGRHGCCHSLTPPPRRLPRGHWIAMNGIWIAYTPICPTGAAERRPRRDARPLHTGTTLFRSFPFVPSFLAYPWSTVSSSLSFCTRGYLFPSFANTHPALSLAEVVVGRRSERMSARAQPLCRDSRSISESTLRLLHECNECNASI